MRRKVLGRPVIFGPWYPASILSFLPAPDNWKFLWTKNFHVVSCGNRTHILHSGIPIVGVLKTNDVLKFNNFSTTRSITIYFRSLDRAHQHLKLCLRGNSRRMTPRTLKQFFLNITSKSMILNSIKSVSKYFIICQYFTLRGAVGGTRGLKTNYTLNFNKFDQF